ncbi:MAG: hypothetical protein NTV51_04105, partial [Verrucomicrobia bacterium]|nr:hypothetical protein [Verrucomicrobiota bacterium]
MPRWWTFVAVGFLGWAGTVLGAEPAEVRREFLAGNYPFALAESEAGFRNAPGNSDWQMLRIEVLLATGRYAEADTAMTMALGS